jgi:hypothetical protein
VTLRFSMTTTCQFEREEVKEVKSDTTHVVESSLLGSITSSTVTKVTEYLWNYQIDYRAFFFFGTDPQDQITLLQERLPCSVRTGMKEAPSTETKVWPSIDMSFNVLLSFLNPNSCLIKFAVDRSVEDCKTPVRNAQVAALVEFNAKVQHWSEGVLRCLNGAIQIAIDMQKDEYSWFWKSQKCFVPVIPIFISRNQDLAQGDLKEVGVDDNISITTVSALNDHESRVSLRLEEISAFLAEQIRSINEKKAEIFKAFSNHEVLSPSFCHTLHILPHFGDISVMFQSSIFYIEDMLRSQLIAAIGKEVQPVDFDEYMIYHHRHLMKEDVEMKAFSFAVRRPFHTPEGTLSVVSEEFSDPIYTHCCRITPKSSVKVPLNAATQISVTGDHYIHGWISHQFSSSVSPRLFLRSHTRQFSSFILLVGSIASNTLFLPKAAIVVTNKDDLKIPLLLETIPSAKEFKDAIESLSPEQQRFAKAYRSMQLESTMFGIMTIQIKPQLEKLLKLPFDSLTKEIKLNQNLVELFIKYQIPSDLLSYQGDAQASLIDKVDYVSQTVKEIYAMIDSMKDKSIVEEKMKAEFVQPQPQQNKSEYAVFRAKDYKNYKPRPAFQSESAAPRAMAIAMESAPQKSSAGFGFNVLGSISSAVSSISLPSFSTSNNESLRMERSYDMRPPVHSSVPASSQVAPQPVQSSSAPAPPPVQSEFKVVEAKQPSPPAQIESKKDAAEPQVEKKIVSQDIETNLVVSEDESFDYSSIPSQLESRLGFLKDAIRPIVIKPGEEWKRRRSENLLSPPVEQNLGKSELTEEKNKAFDLLDALSRSGTLPFEDASLHILIGSAHCFPMTLMNTIIQENINPIEAVEKTSLLLASVIHQKPINQMRNENCQ